MNQHRSRAATPTTTDRAPPGQAPPGRAVTVCLPVRGRVHHHRHAPADGDVCFVAFARTADEAWQRPRPQTFCVHSCRHHVAHCSGTAADLFADPVPRS